MTSYGGYQKTTYGAEGGDDAGGFVYGGSQGGSQTGKRNFDDETLRPVTIKQLLDAEEVNNSDNAEFRIDGSLVTQVTLVGQLREVKPLNTKVNLKIDDGTGVIELVKFVDPDKVDEASQMYQLDQFVRVYGRLKSMGRRQVNAQIIRPVTDYNEVNYHLLEATYVHLLNSRGAAGGKGGVKTEGGDDSMFVGGGNGDYNAGGNNAGGMSRVSGCSGMAQKLYNFLMNTPGGNEGVHSNVIARGTGMSVRDVQAAADELSAQGIVYNLIDDDTWAILEY